MKSLHSIPASGILFVLFFLSILSPRIFAYDDEEWGMGPLGGLFRINASSAFLEVRDASPGTPADAAGLRKGDFIGGAFGQDFGIMGPNRDYGFIGAVQDLGEAIERAESTDGILPLKIFRPGQGFMNLTAAIPAVGSFGAAYPHGSNKFNALYNTACDEIHAKIMADNTGTSYNSGYFGLCLLAHPNWNSTSGSRPFRNSINKVRDAAVGIINDEIVNLAIYETGKQNNWALAPRALFLGEYRRKTGDTSVDPVIQRAAEILANRIQHHNPNRQGIMGHAGYARGDYGGIGINIINAHVMMGMASLKAAGANFSASAGTSGYTINEKFLMSWSWVKRCMNNGQGGDNGNIGYVGWQDGRDSSGRTAGVFAGWKIYQNAGGTAPTTEDLDYHERMGNYVVRQWQRMQHAHAYTAGGVLHYAFATPFLSQREQRFLMDNLRFYFQFHRTTGSGLMYFGGRSRNNSDGNLGWDNVTLYNVAIFQAALNGGLPSFPDPNTSLLHIHMKSPWTSWPALEARYAKLDGLVHNFDCSVTNWQGVPHTSGVSASWSKVSGPGSVSFSSTSSLTPRVIFSVPGKYRLRLAASRSGSSSTEEFYDFDVAGLPGYVHGEVQLEVFTGISGTSVSNMTSSAKWYAGAPDLVSTLSSLDTTYSGDNFGQRIRGVVIPHTTGSYRFYIASDDSSRFLFNSSGDDAGNIQQVCDVNGYASKYQWDKYASQQSATFTLTAGKAYAFEILHKEGGGSEHCAVAWTGPGFSSPQVIGAGNLARPAYTPGQVCAEIFHALSGTSLSSLTNSEAFQRGVPDLTLNLPTLEATHVGDNFGQRIRGFIIPHVSGAYRFHLSSDNSSRLSFNPGGDDWSGITQACYLNGYVSKYQWDKYASQQSAEFNLKAGKAYAFEVLHKEGGGIEHCEVGWTGPGFSTPTVIGGTNLALPHPSPVGSPVSDVFLNLPGNQVTDLTGSEKYLVNAPDVTMGLESLKLDYSADNYGQRARGLIVPKTTGAYRFYITSDDTARFLFNPAGPESSGKNLFCECLSATGPSNWSANPSQQSVEVLLTAGSAYAFEILHKEGTGSHHCNVAWTGPGMTNPQILESDVLFGVESFSEDPIILVPPQDKTFSPGDNLTFNITVGHPGPVVYEWRLNGIAYWGQSPSPQLTFTNVPASLTGTYACAIITPDKTVISPSATISLTGYLSTRQGGLMREVYEGIPGNPISSLTSDDHYPFSPATTSYTASAEAPQNTGSNYGQRLSGWLVPPVSGSYRFFLAADDTAQFWLGSNDSPGSKSKRCEITTFTGYRAYPASGSGVSASITLQAGQRYYLEILHKDGSGGDHVSLAWQMPGGGAPAAGAAPIPGQYLEANHYIPAASDHWKLDDTDDATAQNSSRNLHGTHQNGVLVDQGGAKSATGVSAYYNGSNSYTSIAAPKYNTDTLTFTTWVKRQGTQQPSAPLIFTRAGNSVAGLSLSSNHKLIYHWNNQGYNFANGPTLPDNQWCLAAMSVSPSGVTLFLRTSSGLQSAHHATPIDPEEFDGPMNLANDPYSSGRYFKGWLDDARVYRAALAAEEIEQLWQDASGSGTLPASVVMPKPQAAAAPYTAWIAGFGLTGDRALATADADDDGVPNREEMLLGFNPADPNSRLILSVLSIGEEKVRLRLNRVVTAGIFTLQSSPDLTDPWTDTAIEVTTDGNDFEFEVPRNRNSHFYRAKFRSP